MPDLAPLLLVYDAEQVRSRRAIDWIRRHDHLGLIIAFPSESSELIQIAPELAGRALHRDLHGLDTRTRQVWIGEQLAPHIGARLSGGSWVKFLVNIPVVSRLFWRRFF